MKKNSGRSQEDKKLYLKPTFIVYGSITQMTKTSVGMCQDNPNSYNMAETGAGGPDPSCPAS